MGEIMLVEPKPASSEDITYADVNDTLVGSNAYLNIPDGLDTEKLSLDTGRDTEAGGGERETWGKKIDFLLSVIGFAVDLANVWRFPYLCFKNGGGVFLIPYYLMYFFAGVPLFFMELCLGQYNRKGAITTWGRICPLFKGIGYSVVMIAFYVDFYYNVIISWALYYFVASFNTRLPWSHCDNDWNDKETCYELSAIDMVKSNQSASSVNSSSTTLPVANASWSSWFSGLGDDQCRSEAFNTSGIQSSSEQFFKSEVLNLVKFKDFTNPGAIQWKLVVCLLVIYLVCYFCLWKGISMSGKVVWFTAIFPYVVLFCLLIRGVTLPGASDGIAYYLTPNVTKLLEGEVWFDAATQVFFSLGPGFGVLLAFASYNKFHNNVYMDALITSAINTGTSFLSGFVIFSVLGYMACKSGREIKDVAAEGPGLVFIVYPEALSTMPGASFWSIVFFLMLLTLGLDSSFGGSEAIITALSDEFPILKRNREIFVACLFSTYMLVGLLMCTEGGVFFVEFFNVWAATFGLLIAVLCETIVVSWIYGLKRFCADVREMLGFEPGPFWKFCWAIIGPPFLLATLLYGIYGQIHSEVTAYGVVYPQWMNNLGWILGFSSAVAIPVLAIKTLYQAPGMTFRQKLKCSIRPWRDRDLRSDQYIHSSDETVPMNGLKTVYL